ncbi:hypothetical protein PUH89_16615 [Rhodobacter capsulatus]|nr:hypothetical protein [Rhodobacter capsulatus]WER08908.1 hypothetical protein PUH89_16615 [Rhodobacter capsulatus]
MIDLAPVVQAATVAQDFLEVAMPFASLRPACLLVLPLVLSACVEGLPADPKAPRMSQKGTCFTYVTAEPGGLFALVSGKGDGTLTPLGQKSKPMSAEAVDAAFAKEVQVLGIMPECLAVYARDRSAAQPAARMTAPAPTAPAPTAPKA